MSIHKRNTMSYRYVTRKDVYYTLEYWLKQILGSKKFFKKEILSNISHYLETTIGSWNVLISIPGMKKIESQDLYKYLDLAQLIRTLKIKILYFPQLYLLKNF